MRKNIIAALIIFLMTVAVTSSASSSDFQIIFNRLSIKMLKVSVSLLFRISLLFSEITPMN